MDAEALGLRPATNMHFTLKENTLKRSDLDDFVNCYFGRTALPRRQGSKAAQQHGPTSRHDRNETERFKSFTYDELTKRDKMNLDISWLKDEALEESANLPATEVIAADITAELEAALEQFATIAGDLKR
jgi:type I restriction enzyme M protein